MKFKPRNHNSGHARGVRWPTPACWPSFPGTPAVEKLVSSLVIAEMSQNIAANQ
jgi:hypothetical protein